MTLWSRMARIVDRLLGEPTSLEPDVDPAKVDQAIRIIQAHVDAERRARNVALLRVSDLSPEAQARLADELAQVLGVPADGASSWMSDHLEKHDGHEKGGGEAASEGSRQ